MVILSCCEADELVYAVNAVTWSYSFAVDADELMERWFIMRGDGDI